MASPDLDYVAICLDTSAFHRKGYLLERGALKQLEQFKNSYATFLVSEVVHNELVGHLQELIETARRNLGNAQQEADEHLRPSMEEYMNITDIIFGGGLTDRELAETRLKSFYERTEAVMLPTNHVDVTEIMKMYFETEAPFEKKKDKKFEFPDAIALMSIEWWAEMMKGKVIVVSHDKGWSEFCQKSKWLVCLDDLSKALTHFQPHNIANNVIDELKLTIEEGRTNAILDAIKAAIEKVINDANVDVEAQSLFYVNDEYGAATYLSHDFEGDWLSPDINLLRVSGATVVLQLPVSIKTEVVGQFGLSMRDPIDGDLVRMTKRKLSQEYEYQTEVILTLTGDFSRGLDGLEVEKVELTDGPGPVDFGEIEFMFDREDEGTD